ncbi:bacterial type II and III secretion system family protein, partial [Vibrio parahaemolyticus VPTS-2010_2]
FAWCSIPVRKDQYGR